ncbi:MAG: hypothetical protein PHV42_04535, partial [Candidatus Pacebacteria bacterium]|nr:hypothetical protein [Candidatus Paceibacterota bacterium]
SIVSKLCVIKKTHLRYDPNNFCMDDYDFTAQHLLSFGSVLVNNYVYPSSKHYEEGGLGTYEERVDKKTKDAALLMSKFPGLYNYNNTKNTKPNSELRYRFTSLSQVEKWRASL